MQARNINANQLAHRSGLGSSTVYTFLRRDRRGARVHSATLAKIALGLGVPVALLLEPDVADPGAAELLTLWSTLDGEAKQRVLALARSLTPPQG